MDASAERERALTFLAAVDDDAVERTAPFPGGKLLVDLTYPRMWDANHIRLEGRWAGSAEELAEEGKHRSRELGLGHCMITTADDAEAARLGAPLRVAGFRPERHVVMVHRGGAPEIELGQVEDVPIDATAVVREAILRESPFGDDDTVNQVLAYQSSVHDRIGDAWMGAFHEGRVAATCRRIARNGVGQIEDVGTLPQLRRRGLASALVVAGLDRLHGQGEEMCLIVADDGSQAAELYHRLGFEDVAAITRFRLFPLS
ncbi:MAG: GNAT family N-acetyltransferase [Thermoleophilaceae bacterium]